MSKTKTTRKTNPMRKTLKPGQSVRVRLQSGKFTKFRSGRNLIFEVIEKKSVPVRFKSGPRKGRVNKSKKPITKIEVVGYLNQVDKKTKRPIPKKYSAVQYRIFTAKVSRKPRAADPLADSVTIRFNNRSLMLDQLLMKKAEPLKKLIRSYKAPLVQVYSRLKTSRGDDLAGPGIIIAPSTPWLITAKMLVMNLVFGPLRDNSIRMSPKKFQKRKTNQMEFVDVTFTVRSVEK